MAEDIKAIELLNELLLEMGFTSGIAHKLGDQSTNSAVDVAKFNLSHGVSAVEERNYYLLYCKTTNRVTLLTGVFEILEAIWDLKDGELGKTQKYVNLADPGSLDKLKIILENLKRAHYKLEIEAVETLTKQLGGQKKVEEFIKDWIKPLTEQ